MFLDSCGFQKYLKKTDREDAVVMVITQGEEPESFTSLFNSWDPDLWETLTTYSDVKSRIEQWNNAIADADS